MRRFFMFTAEAHSAIELVNAALCFIIAQYAWERWRETPTGWSLLWCMGFCFTGVSDILHALLSLADSELVTYWVPWT